MPLAKSEQLSRKVQYQFLKDINLISKLRPTVKKENNL